MKPEPSKKLDQPIDQYLEGADEYLDLVEEKLEEPLLARARTYQAEITKRAGWVLSPKKPPKAPKPTVNKHPERPPKPTTPPPANMTYKWEAPKPSQNGGAGL